jgi:hypothetical protein
VCDGIADICPVDAFVSASTECRAVAGVCDDADFCDGLSAACTADQKLTSECRSAVGLCDVAELCDGATDDCPADAFAADGTSCEDGTYCNGEETCLASICQIGPGDPCLGEPLPVCSESGNVCLECLVNEDCTIGSFCEAGTCYEPVPMAHGWQHALLIVGLITIGLTGLGTGGSPARHAARRRR